MKTRDFNKVKKLIERGQEIKTEIDELNKMALKFAEFNDSITLKFSHKDNSKKKDILDSDGSLISDSSSPYRMIFTFGSLDTHSSNDGKTNHEVTINSQTSLACIGTIISFKKSELDEIVKQLKSF